jgi:hypothetical protein
VDDLIWIRVEDDYEMDAFHLTYHVSFKWQWSEGKET